MFVQIILRGLQAWVLLANGDGLIGEVVCLGLNWVSLPNAGRLLGIGTCLIRDCL